MAESCGCRLPSFSSISESVSDKRRSQLCLDADLKLSVLLRQARVRSVHEFYDFYIALNGVELLSKLRGNSDYPKCRADLRLKF